MTFAVLIGDGVGADPLDRAIKASDGTLTYLIPIATTAFDNLVKQSAADGCGRSEARLSLVIPVLHARCGRILTRR